MRRITAHTMDKPLFPLFRKYPQGQALFKILNEAHFQELKRDIGGWSRFEKQAEQFNDRMLIADMIAMKNGHWVECTEAEWLTADTSTPR